MTESDREELKSIEHAVTCLQTARSSLQAEIKHIDERMDKLKKHAKRIGYFSNHPVESDGYNLH